MNYLNEPPLTSRAVIALLAISLVGAPALWSQSGVTFYGPQSRGPGGVVGVSGVSAVDTINPAIGRNRKSNTTTGPQNETSVAVNPRNPANIVVGANDYTDGDSTAAVYVSFDSGKTWSTRTLADPSGFTASGDPALAFDSNGTAYYAILALKRTPPPAAEGSIYVYRSTDGGVTWGTPVQVANGSPSINHDKPYVAVDRTGKSFDGRIYVAWTEFDVIVVQGQNVFINGRVKTSFSSNGGASFSSATTLSSAVDAMGAVPAVDHNGHAYVTWFEEQRDRLAFAKSTNGGLSFSPRLQGKSGLDGYFGHR